MYKQEEKSLSIQMGETIVIKKVLNSITKEILFLITSDSTNNAIITKNIVIDGTKLECN
jgi:hypothetical protein